MQSSQIVHVFGHKNPDADAICSAIAYADFKNKKHGGGHAPARCGNSNARIDAILDQFHVPLPAFIGDVTPRIRDIMVGDVRIAHLDSTCAEALDLIEAHDVRALPVLDADERVAGVVSIFRLGDFFLPKPQQQRRMREVHTNLDAIVRSLGARVLHLAEPGRIEDLFVRVGAMDVRSFGTFMEEEQTPAEKSIIVVGDRWDIQQKSIQLGVRLLVITGNHDPEPQTLDLAREEGISLIVSPYDSATTAWTIRAATRIEPLVERNFERFGPDDKVRTVRRKVATSFAPAYIVTDGDNRLLGVFTKSDLLKPGQRKIILVDHNEITQAVSGADEVEILEIIDHHRLGNIPTRQPILFCNEPVGSTCTIVADIHRREGIPPSPEIAGVLMGGVISDTLNLNSPTSTAVDAQILEWLAGIAGVDAAALAERIFSSGSVILSHSESDVILSDCKIYHEDGVRFSVSQVEELAFDNFRQHAGRLLAALEEYRARQNLAFSVLLVTDINTQNSLLAVRGDQDFIDHIAYPALEKGRVFDLPGVVSRKKQLVPYLTSLLATAAVPHT